MSRKSSRKLSVLCIDDEPDHADLLRLALEQAHGTAVELETMTDPERIGARVTEAHYDVIFLDYQLGSMSGIEALAALREAGYAGPAIMLTAHGNEYIAAEVTRAGADEYLIKSDLNEERVRQALENAKDRTYERRDIEALHRRVEQLESLSRALAESNTEIAINARIDPLTSVFNRRAWDEMLSTESARSSRYGHPYSVIILDVDYFKLYNDSAGHQAGDECLQRIAECVRNGCRSVDAVGRYGGEEFVLLLPETDLAGAESVAARLRDTVESAAIPHPGLPDNRPVTISLGVAAGPGDGTAVVAAADRALYEAKSSGRNCYRLSESGAVVSS
jgi:diguanylate cyclase (GGDEF)-like protein